jgi:hypothetical protein
MGTGTHGTDPQTGSGVKKSPRCSICRQTVQIDCDWMQGRCPHRPESATITVVRSRIQNLIKLFTGKQ